jgi:hypothetical protein
LSPTACYKDLLSTVALKLEEIGFCRKGTNFYLWEHGNCGLVNFQKSGKSMADIILFTVNVGTASGALLEFFGNHAARVPSIEECHWRQRLGFLFPDSSDRWWHIETVTSPSALADEISNALLRLALPAIKKYMSDESLRDLWSSGNAPGITELERLKYLSVLLKLSGSKDALDAIKNTLNTMSEGRPTARMVALHLARLEGTRNG